MKLLAFRIKNFRSIVDSGWVKFSPDGITVLVGQNESGKSSVLEALHVTLSSASPTPDDFRIGAELPEVSIRMEINPDAVDTILTDASANLAQAAKSYLSQSESRLDLTCGWESVAKDGKTTYEARYTIPDPKLAECVSRVYEAIPAGEPDIAIDRISDQSESDEFDSSESSASDSSTEATLDECIDDLVAALLEAIPLGVLFNEESGRLPNQVDIDEKGRPTGEGARAALNFLQIAEIDLPSLLRVDRRARENTLARANSLVSDDFNNFWSQSIGKSGRLTLKCDLDYYPLAAGEKAGKPHLVFWIGDGTTQLYPKQRSQGVRWFLSFYLQLKASEKAKNKRVFLLDEPGANLHSKAQGDVLKLVNQLRKDTSTVVYSTHSPQMLEYPKLFRVHAVQRSGERDDSPTQVIDAHRLGTASTDTLSPVLTAMGADLSQHQVIRKSNNVLLEEMSSYYYLTSFWRLLSVKQEAHFIAATGVNKIEALANMFRGWGLEFIAAFDDDKQGREAYKSMKRQLFGNSDELASRKLVKFPDCPTIEDVFSREDFAKFVAKVPVANITASNADFLKSESRSKPVTAFGFALDVEDGKISIDDLSKETVDKIRAVLEAITSRLQ